jgi:hypothetical protein
MAHATSTQAKVQPLRICTHKTVKQADQTQAFYQQTDRFTNILAQFHFTFMGIKMILKQASSFGHISKPQIRDKRY